VFCPNCKYEYKLGVERCPDCGAELVETLQEAELIPEEESRFVLLCTAQDLVYASLLKETLETNDIPCLIKGGGGVMTTLEPLSGYAKIYVPERRYEESLKIKEQLEDVS
jgi:hypothetical protein